MFFQVGESFAGTMSNELVYSNLVIKKADKVSTWAIGS
jgi:hypothetical protein